MTAFFIPILLAEVSASTSLARSNQDCDIISSNTNLSATEGCSGDSLSHSRIQSVFMMSRTHLDQAMASQAGMTSDR